MKTDRLIFNSQLNADEVYSITTIVLGWLDMSFLLLLFFFFGLFIGYLLSQLNILLLIYDKMIFYVLSLFISNNNV